MWKDTTGKVLARIGAVIFAAICIVIGAVVMAGAWLTNKMRGENVK